ncbi:MAG: M23 family metallopeptidase [Deltaproteobacteria bacterium]|nr:M23 family metallopeptidase [Deltaproteobacteria bacterium]
MRRKFTGSLILITVFLAGVFAGDAVGRERVWKYASSKRLAERLGLGTRLAATLMLNGGFPDTWVDAAGGTRPPKFLQWPIPGHRLGRGFGSNNGKHLAIDASASIGTLVRSMAPGIVAYADNGVKGYGNLVMVLHPGGWVTLYAHLDKFKVEPGQRVRRRQILALSGNTGLSRGPHLHFALLIRGKPVDPMRYMRGAPGHPGRISQLDSR